MLYMLTAIIRKTDFLQQMMPSYGTQNAMSICFSLIVKELDDLYDFAVNKIEPHFVRGDGKLPAKNHMYTHISFIIITRNQVLPDVEKALQSKNFSKNYMFGARGFSNIRLACVTPSRYSVISNKAGTKIAEFLTEILLHIDHYEE